MRKRIFLTTVLMMVAPTTHAAGPVGDAIKIGMVNDQNRRQQGFRKRDEGRSRDVFQGSQR